MEALAPAKELKPNNQTIAGGNLPAPNPWTAAWKCNRLGQENVSRLQGASKGLVAEPGSLRESKKKKKGFLNGPVLEVIWLALLE